MKRVMVRYKVKPDRVRGERAARQSRVRAAEQPDSRRNPLRHLQARGRRQLRARRLDRDRRRLEPADRARRLQGSSSRASRIGASSRPRRRRSNEVGSYRVFGRTRTKLARDDSGDAHATVAKAREEFLAIVADIRPELHRYCARLTGSVIEGEDIVQDTLAKAFYALSLSTEVPPLRPWLFRIAHNAALDFLKSHGHRLTELRADLTDVAGFDDSPIRSRRARGPRPLPGAAR